MDSSKMQLIPAGEFVMGSTKSEIDHLVRNFSKTGATLVDLKPEIPQHQVYLDAFYIDSHQITNAQYRRFLRDSGYREPKGFGLINGKKRDDFEPWKNSLFNHPDQPVVCITWHEAAAYAHWTEKRLPTEAEWEKAAQGPTGANTFEKIQPYKVNDGACSKVGVDCPFPVARLSPNDYGLYDMIGNVWEWCLDEWDEKFYEKEIKNPVAGEPLDFSKQDFSAIRTPRVLRGGGWDSPSYHLRTKYRCHHYPMFTSGNNVGFRCAKDAGV